MGELSLEARGGKMLEIYVKNSKIRKEKKSSAWPLVALGAGIGGLWYWKKRKEKELAQAQAIERARTYQNQILPPVKKTIVLPAETGSPESRLRAMGINTSAPTQYQSDENYKEIK